MSDEITSTTSDPVPGDERGQDTSTGEEQPDFGSANVEAPGRKKGPLMRLTERASQSTNKLIDNLPQAVRPVLEKGRGVIPVKSLEVVDETIQSPEAQRVAGSAIDLTHAVTALTLRVLAIIASGLEGLLNIEREEPTETTNRATTGVDDAPRETQSNQSEFVQHKTKAVDLFERYKTVVFTAVSKVLKGKGRQGVTEQSERYDPHSIDKVVTSKVQKGVKFVEQVAAYSLSQASQFNGPGSSSIVQPTAHYIISKLPDNAKRVVRESRSPFTN